MAPTGGGWKSICVLCITSLWQCFGLALAGSQAPAQSLSHTPSCIEERLGFVICWYLSPSIKPGLWLELCWSWMSKLFKLCPEYCGVYKLIKRMRRKVQLLPLCWDSNILLWSECKSFLCNNLALRFLCLALYFKQSLSVLS